MTKYNEKTPLLGPNDSGVMDSLGHESASYKFYSTSKDYEKPNTGKTVKLQKHLTLFHAVVFIVVNVTGTGIFITPSAVTKGVGSIGATLIMWVACGLYSLSLALCYAELGTAFPVAGGDYKYIQETLGPLPAFMCLYIYVLMGPVAAAVMSRTAVEYILPSFCQEHNVAIIITIAIFLHLSAAAMNSVTVKWTARAMAVCTFFKLLTFAVIIALGGVQVARGNVDHFAAPFAGSSTSLGPIALGIIPGFVSYGGWEMASALAGEMKNPKRDLPLSLVISLTLVTSLYLLINAAYFTVLTPAEFIASNAVGVSFASKTMAASVQWIIPATVFLSASGALFAIYLGFPRYTYAGAKDGSFPEVLSFLHIRHMTPLPAIALQLVGAVFFASATFIDLQGLFLILGVNIQLKIGVALVGLLRLKLRMDHTPRTLKVPLALVVVCLVLVVTITLMALIEDPCSNGLGCLLFLLGLPLFYLSEFIKTSSRLQAAVATVTIFTQKLMLVVPSEDKAD